MTTTTDDTLFTVIRGGEIFAPDPMGRREILISGERILAIGEGFADKTATLGGARVIDASGRKVVPGFIDQHLHFLGGGDFEGPLGRVPELHVSWITEGGVTTAVVAVLAHGLVPDMPWAAAVALAKLREGTLALPPGEDPLFEGGMVGHRRQGLKDLVGHREAKCREQRSLS